MAQFLLIFAVLFAVVYFVSVPLRRTTVGAVATGPMASAEGEVEHQTRVADLEAAREAKYREILDAELDFRTGKLSEEDYQQLDAGLRAEAIDILHALEAAGA